MLDYVGVEGGQAVRGSGVQPQHLVQLLPGIVKKGIVKEDYLAAGAVVPVQGLHLLFPEFLLQAAPQEVPVTATPAVDALLDVAHHKGVGAAVHAAMQQRAEVFPLHV